MNDLDKINKLQKELNKERLAKKKLQDKIEKDKQEKLPGMAGYLITPMQRRFAIIRGITPEAKRDSDVAKTHSWCAVQAGVSGTKGSIKSVASKWMQNSGVLGVIAEYRALQEKRVEDDGDKVLRDLLELNEMVMGRKAVPFSVVDESGDVYVSEKIEFNPTVAKAVIELRGKHKSQKLWSDKMELTGEDGAPLSVAREVVYVNKDNVKKLADEAV